MIDFLKKNIKLLSLISIGVIIAFSPTVNRGFFLYLIGIFLYTVFTNKIFVKKLDNFFLITQAKLIGPKFRYKKLSNIESLKEFDQKEFFTKKQLKAHWWGLFVFLCYPLVALPLTVAFGDAAMIGTFIFFYLFSVFAWILFYYSDSTKCELNDCKARRRDKTFIKISSIDKGITRRYSESSTDKDGLRTTNHYVTRKFETTFQCNCCKRQFVTNRYVQQSA